MTSEVDALKTNEILRRRKLRLQQVREQSKDIAKKIRQRASSEKFKHLVNLDANKEKEYLEQQDKFIKKLEELHAKSIQNLGASHRNAAEATQQENKLEKVDLSKQRAREAALELRRQKQEKLDKRKKLLDRKLQAREIANELSREKSAVVANKSKSSLKSAEESQKSGKPEVVSEQASTSKLPDEDKDQEEVVTSDMATQCCPESMPNEWEPNIPSLPLPKDDTPEEFASKTPENLSEKNKKTNLFALSDEMPMSLRGGPTNLPEDTPTFKPTLLVSDYIQNRDLRLRDFDPKPNSKKSTEDLQKIKQTILRTRAAKAEARPSKVDRPKIQDSLDNVLSKKSSVTMYNHSTRDVRDIPCEDRKFVSRDHQYDEDAYYQAMKETSSEQLAKEKEHKKRLEDMRHKIAMSKQNVEKEYKNTMAFLKCLSKEKEKPIKSAYKDSQQEQMMTEYKQRKLQHEFRKIQRECRMQNQKPPTKPCSKSKFVRMKTPENDRDNFDTQDFQYSWMPVPESDKGLAVHIIPTKLKEQKTGNTVKFSKIDSYHEYRSRHRHTPPTKDTCGSERQNVAPVDFGDDLDSEASTSTSTVVGGTSVEDLRLEKDNGAKSSDTDKYSEAERIIIYKVLDSKDKRAKVKKKAQKRSLNREEIDNRNVSENYRNGDEHSSQPKPNDDIRIGDTETSGIAKHLKEGIYKTVQQKGNNMAATRFTDDQKQKSPASAKRNQQQQTVDHACGGNKDIQIGELISDAPSDTSSSSFKSASNAKESQPHQAAPNVADATGLPGGFVKVVDEKGQEAGKFFIGASGFLKDNAYEVVIKLRKTDSTKDVPKETVSKEQKSESTATEPEENTRTTSSETKYTNKPTADVGVGEEMIKITDLNSKVMVTSSNHNHLVDRGVDVPFGEHFGHRKESSETKPGTSVSVQTSFHSPELRYQRMSSSTSTAYMSPPDVILPKYLNRNNYNEKYTYYEHRRPNVYVVNHEPHVTPRKTPAKSKQSRSPLGKNIQKSKNLMTPPNTARSCFSDYSRNSSCKKKSVPIATDQKTMKKHKCEKRKISKTCLKSHIRKTKRALSSNLVAPSPSLLNTNVHPVRSSKLNSGANKVNPVVKWYVDKLLHMNKEGLKTIDVLNQDCSSVTTPGSSVIDDYNNFNHRNSDAKPNISLEQLKQLIAQHVMKKYAHYIEEYENQASIGDTGLKASSKSIFRFPKKKSVHKVKSLNISRSLFLRKPPTTQKPNCTSSCPTSGTSPRDDSRSNVSTKQKHRSKSSPTPRRPSSEGRVKHSNSLEGINKRNSTNMTDLKKASLPKPRIAEDDVRVMPSQVSEPPISSGNTGSSDFVQQPCLPLNTSTQTSRNIDEDIHYMKMAEDKLQNMEKIADLTEQCTQRLSNLAKVLEEVRKNKLSYSHVSESQSASDTDQVSGQNSDTRTPMTTYEPIIEIKEKETSSSSPPERIRSPPPERIRSPQTTPPSSDATNPGKESDSKAIEPRIEIPQTKRSPRPKSPDFIAKTYNLRSPNTVSRGIDHTQLKTRAKPPPALMRRCLKRTQEYIVPHELSTVVEVDSPISTKHKNQPSKHSVKDESIDSESDKERKSNDDGSVAEEKKDDSDLLQTNKSTSHAQDKISEDAAENSKVQMMDLQKFNDIMLKPFISIQEYAKQCNMSKLEEGSNIETLLIGDVINDELSSLHSDGSLPDVIAELLKRNIISEPFKFDTASNINSTSATSDSTHSVLALSKVRRSSKKSSKTYLNKENMEETSDSLSNSSNPDLENAFKKLGMGWASSTLKKTKEHLALSSSSTNTSSSSLSQFKLKNIRMKEFPALVPDSVSSVRNATNVSSRSDKKFPKHPTNGIKSAGQQKCLSNSLTVKQFLTTELAKRITFSDNSRKNDTEEEFVSLCETKMPEDMQRATKHGDRSGDSNPRARTSTPVQLYKSAAYHSSTSSNVSNGLFSNADDLSSVKGTSNSMRNHSTSDKDDLTIPNFSLRTRKALSSDCSKSD